MGDSLRAETCTHVELQNLRLSSLWIKGIHNILAKNRVAPANLSIVEMARRSFYPMGNHGLQTSYNLFHSPECDGVPKISLLG